MYLKGQHTNQSINILFYTTKGGRKGGRKEGREEGRKEEGYDDGDG